VIRSIEYDQRFTEAAVHLNLNGVGINAIQGSGADTSEHCGFLRPPASKATWIFTGVNYGCLQK